MKWCFISLLLLMVSGCSSSQPVKRKSSAPAFRVRRPSSSSTTKVSRKTQDKHGPIISIKSPRNNATVNGKDIVVSGYVSDVSGVSSLYANGKKCVKEDNKGNFNATVSLKEGSNVISVVATDSIGNKSTKKITVYRKKERLFF